MSDIAVTYTWPTNLPLPADSFGGSPRAAVASSPLESGYISRRKRFDQTYTLLQLTWCLTTAELAIFDDFYQEHLGSGTAQFAIELRYPTQSALVWWIARFIGDYQVDKRDGLCMVTAAVDLLAKKSLGA